LAGVHHAGIHPAVEITVNPEVAARIPANKEARKEHHGNDEHHTRHDSHPHQHEVHLVRAIVLRGLLVGSGRRAWRGSVIVELSAQLDAAL